MAKQKEHKVDKKKRIKHNKNSKFHSKNKKVQQSRKTQKSKDILKLARDVEKMKKKQVEVEAIDKIKEKARKAQQASRRKNAGRARLQLKDSRKEEKQSKTDLHKTKKVVQKTLLFKWTAPVRIDLVFRKKSFLSVLLLVLLFELYLAVLGHYMLMLVMIALLFLIYVLGTHRPDKVEHKITARGIDTFDRLFEWEELTDFWFSKKNDQELLIIRTKIMTIPKLIMLINPEDRATIFSLMQEDLLYRDIRKQNWLDKMTFGDYIPLEDV